MRRGFAVKMEPLRSLDNPSFRRLQRLLKDGSARREEGRALAEGPHLAQEALRAGRARALWTTPEAAADGQGSDLLRQAAAAGLQAGLLSPALLGRLSETRSPQGWLCEVDTAGAAGFGSAPRLLALDGIQDPGNIGTLLRCAWAAQAGVLLGPGCADPWAPKVLRAGAGAHFHLALRQAPDLAEALGALPGEGWKVCGSSPKGATDYRRADLRGRVCLVLGSEGGGMSPAVHSACQELLRIPYPGSAESLNAAVSGALLLFESLRQAGC